ncbi:MAG: ADYC domain-containing protein [Myxococcota bacterium]
MPDSTPYYRHLCSCIILCVACEPDALEPDVFEEDIDAAVDIELEARIGRRHQGILVNTGEINTDTELGRAFSPEFTKDRSFHEGHRLDAIWYTEYHFVDPASLYLIDGELFGVADGVGTISGLDFDDTIWWVDELDDQGVLHYHDVVLDVDIDNNEYLYDFYWYVSDSIQIPMCNAMGNGGSTSATILENIAVDEALGTISPAPGNLYLACDAGAIGKAVARGYHPDDHGTDVLQAAVRMIRADYCGDGNSWTAAGTELFSEEYREFVITEALGLPGEVVPNTQLESFWTPHGAKCLSHRRYGNGIVTCENSVLLFGCFDQSPFTDDALFRTEIFMP